MNSMENIKKTFSLKVVSPTKLAFERNDVVFLKLRTLRGDYGILPNHTNLMSSLGEGMMLVKTLNEEMSYFVSSGFLEFSNNHATVLAEEIILAKNEEEVRKMKQEILEKAIEAKRKEDQDILGTKKRLHDTLLK